MESVVISKKNILVVDDQVDIRTTVQFLLSKKGYKIWEAESPEQAKSILANVQINMVITDMNFKIDTTSGQEGLEFVDYLSTHHKELTVIVMTAWSSVSVAVQSMQFGAKDFIEKPWENHLFYETVERQFSIQQSQTLNRFNANGKTNFEAKEQGIISHSDTFNHLLEKIQKVALSHASVLLTGENGTGKSLLASYIHQCSGRQESPFISVNLGAIPEQLFESELFGHKRGAFTGALDDRQGRFSLAGSGTFFLDELAAASIANQAKLLRVLESKEYERVGDSKTELMQCRLIAATNANLSEEIASGNFREDLYYRLNTVEINVPALRERKEDIIPIAQYYLQSIGQEYGKPELTLSPSCRDKLIAYSWPGNTRELKHAIERAVIFSDSQTIEIDMINLSSDAKKSHLFNQVEPLAKVEENLILEALKQSNGNINVSAEMLGISRSSLYRRIEKHGVSLKKVY